MTCIMGNAEWIKMELEETGSGEQALLNCTIRYDSTNYKILAERVLG